MGRAWARPWNPGPSEILHSLRAPIAGVHIAATTSADGTNTVASSL